MANLTNEEVERIYQDLVKGRPLTPLQEMKRDGTLARFLKAFEKQATVDNQKRASMGLDPIPHEYRLRYMWELNLRSDQRPPPGEWSIWLYCAGRGAGKTYALSCLTNQFAYENPGCRIGLFAQTLGSAKDTMVEGKSGILRTARPWDPPRWVPSRSNGRIYWPNGSQGYVYPTSDPEKLRGPEFDLSWADEFCFWSRPEEAWDQVIIMTRSRTFGTPKIYISTTPQSIPLLDEIAASPDTVESSGPTYNNRFIAPASLKRNIRKFYGTAQWIQEVEGKRLRRAQGALWDYEDIDETREPMPPREEIERIVISVDPAIETRKKASDTNTTGIIVAGLSSGHAYILEDISIDARPERVGEQIISAYDRWGADEVIFEKNQGGQWGPSVLRLMRPSLPIKSHYAGKQNKYSRAMPIRVLYSQGVVHHVKTFEKLETEMCTYTRKSRVSPDRLDALVYAVGVLLDPKEAKPKFAFRSLYRGS